MASFIKLSDSYKSGVCTAFPDMQDLNEVFNCMITRTKTLNPDSMVDRSTLQKDLSDSGLDALLRLCRGRNLKDLVNTKRTSATQVVSDQPSLPPAR